MQICPAPTPPVSPSHQPASAAPNLHGADLDGAVFTGPGNTSGIEISSDLTNASVSGTSFATVAGYGGGGLTGTPSLPTGAALVAGQLVGPNATLQGASLHGADLAGLDLTYADLDGADLSGADLAGTALIGTRMFGTDLTGATLTGVRGYSIFGTPTGLPSRGV